MNIIIENGLVISDKIFRNGSVVIEDNRIVDVGFSEDIARRYDGHGYIKVDASNKLVSPGLVNSHTHIAMTLFRGYVDDIFLQDWLEKWIWPMETLVTDKDIELGAMLGAAESLLGGVTSVCTLYHYYPNHNEASAALKANLREVFGIAMFSWMEKESVRNVEDALRRWHGKDGLIRVAPAPHAPYTVSPRLWREAEELRKNGDERYGDKGKVILTSHVLEDWNEIKMIRERFNVEVPDGSVYRYLDGLGVLSPSFLAAHSIHVNDIDLDLIKRKGVNIAHNPVANLKLAMGIAPIPRMLEKGINVGLGTDGPAANNTLDLIETMKLTALIHKEAEKDPTILPANIVFKMATEYGGKAVGYDDLGIIKKGYLADIILIDLRKPNLTPLFNPYSHLVYAVKYGDVDTVIVNGDLVVEDRVFKKFNLEHLLNKVFKRSIELVERGKEMREEMRDAEFN